MVLLCILLLIVCVFDYGWRRIPNGLVLSILVLGLLRSCVGQGVSGGLCYLTRMLFVGLGMYGLFQIGSLGAGDVKLFSVCAGYFFGVKILYFLFFALLIGAGISLIKIIAERNAKERLQYLCEYVTEVIRTGHWKLYFSDRKEQCRHSIPLAGPALCSVLLCVGGVY